MTRTVVGARFQTAGRMYFFEPGPVDDLSINEWVIVQTELGQDAARVQILPTDSPLVQIDPPLGTLVRKATASDKFELAKHKRREAESTTSAAETARRLKPIIVDAIAKDFQSERTRAVFIGMSASNSPVTARSFIPSVSMSVATHTPIRSKVTSPSSSAAFMACITM